MKTIKDIYDSVCNWNSQRYDRIYNAELLVNLLNEELSEYFDSQSMLDQLDALCDTAYVALGGIWKCEVQDEINQAYSQQSFIVMRDVVESAPFPPEVYIRGLVESLYRDGTVPTVYTLHCIITLCFFGMYGMGLNTQQAIASMDAVCESNDSKSVKKTASNCKANDGDKGSSYISPSKKLTKILEQAHVNRH